MTKSHSITVSALLLHHHQLLLLLLLLLVGAAMQPVVVVVADSSAPPVVSATCDPRGMIPQGSSFWGHVGFALELLVENAPFVPGYSYKTRTGGGDSPAFAEAHCQAYCPPERCQACLRQLSSDIWRICNSALGARVEYPDCWLHYECFYF